MKTCKHCNVTYNEKEGRTCACFCPECHGEIDSEGWCPNYCLEEFDLFDVVDRQPLPEAIRIGKRKVE